MHIINNKDKYGGVIDRPIRPVLNDYPQISKSRKSFKKHRFHTRQRQAPKTCQKLISQSHVISKRKKIQCLIIFILHPQCKREQTIKTSIAMCSVYDQTSLQHRTIIILVVVILHPQCKQEQVIKTSLAMCSVHDQTSLKHRIVIIIIVILHPKCKQEQAIKTYLAK